MIRAVPYTSLWFGVFLWTLVAGALVIGTSWLLYQDFLFAYDSKSTLAMVERKFLKVGQGKHGPTYTPCLDYRYQAQHMEAEAESTVRSDTYSSVNVGQQIPVLYLPDEFGNNRIDLPAENRQVELITYGLIAASLITSVGGAFVIRYYVRQNKLNRYLLAHGLSCRGKVTEIKFDLVGTGRTKRYYLLFTFRDNLGAEKRGRSWYLKSGDENLWQEGSALPVFYDPNNSARFTVDLNPGPTNR